MARPSYIHAVRRERAEGFGILLIHHHCSRLTPHTQSETAHWRAIVHHRPRFSDGLLHILAPCEAEGTCSR
jgi:hypothetical protein